MRDVGTVDGGAVIAGCIVGLIVISLPVSAPAAIGAGVVAAAGDVVVGGARVKPPSGRPGMT